MENDVLDSSLSTSELRLTNEVNGYFKEIAKWANFLAIVGFVMLGLMVLASIFATFMMGSLATQSAAFGGMAGTGFIGIIYLLLALLYFFPIRFLYRFAKNIKLAQSTGDQLTYTEAFKNLKSFFKFIGIFTAVILGFYLVMLVIGLGFGALGSMF